MTRVIAIDPGLKASGIAEFIDGKLARCDCVHVKGFAGPKQYRAMSHALFAWIDTCPGDIAILAIEHMKTRRGRADAHAALIDLSHVSGGVWSLVEADRMVSVSTAEWTHMRPKHINAQRVKKTLTPVEAEVLNRGLAGALKSHRKEVYDAVGIGLHIVERWS